MKLCASALLALLLLLVLPALCLAGETLEGDEYTIQIPDGFTETMSMSGSGSIKIRSNFGMLPIDGVPETTVYMYGGNAPQGTIMVSRINLKSGTDGGSLAGLGMNQLDQLRAQLPDGVEMRTRKVGKYDALEISMEMGLGGEDLSARMAMIACGDFALTVLLQVQDDALPSLDTTWEQMLGSIKIEKSMSKVVLYGGIGIGAVLLLFLWARFSKTGPPTYVRAEVDTPSRFDSGSFGGNAGRFGGRGGAGAEPEPADIRAPSAPLRSPRVAPVARPGLRSTLEPVERWKS